jgi:mannose-6-phosphate isomerase-like protein (cupin superfamily)
VASGRPEAGALGTPDGPTVEGGGLVGGGFAIASLSDTRQPAGEMTALHLHTRYEERFWVVSGALTVWGGDKVVELRSGDFHAIPINVPHAVRSGPEGCHALHISSPAGFAELIMRTEAPAHLATPETELDLDLFMAVTTELGDVVLGPPGMLPADYENSPK